MCVCDTNHVGVPMNDHGCPPKSKPMFISGMCQYVCTAARE